MSKTPTQPKPSDADLAQRVSLVERQMADLTARRVAATMRIVDMERQDKAPVPTSGPREQELRERVAALLGSEAFVPKSPEFAELQLERDAIDRALPILAARATAAHGALAEARLDARSADWRFLVRRRALAIALLRKVNDEVEAFAASLASGPIRPSLPLQWPAGKLLGGTKGTSGTGTTAYEFLEQAVKAGFVTRRELDNVKEIN